MGLGRLVQQLELELGGIGGPPTGPLAPVVVRLRAALLRLSTRGLMGPGVRLESPLPARPAPALA
eukprot:15215386-Alexandrium_andersonii.AAC.1